MYNELGVEKGREQFVMVSAPFNSSKDDRERIVQVRPLNPPVHPETPNDLCPPAPWCPYNCARDKTMFESFALPGLDVAVEPVLTAFGFNAPTGIVIDIGDDGTCAFHG